MKQIGDGLPEKSLYKPQRVVQISELNDFEDFMDERGINKRSVAWKHFHYDKKANAAICKICYAVYVIRKSITTPMMKHLREEHSNKFLKRTSRSTREYSNMDITRAEKSFQNYQSSYITTKTSQKKYNVWKYFLYSQISSEAVCQICSRSVKVFNDSPTTLYQHLRDFHKNIYQKNKSEQEENDINNDEEHEIKMLKKKGNPYFDSSDQSCLEDVPVKTEDKNNVKLQAKNLLKKDPSDIWDFFQYLQSQQKSVCNLCRQVFVSHNRSTQSLFKHLSYSHRIKFQKGKDGSPQFLQINANQINTNICDNVKKQQHIDEEYIDGGTIEDNVKKRSKAWQLFLYDEKNNRSICKICKKVYVTKNGTTSPLLKHIDMHLRDNPTLIQQFERPSDHHLTNQYWASNSRSIVWQFFDRQIVNGNAKCYLCDQFYPCYNGQTSELLGHLKSQHTQEFKRLSGCQNVEDFDDKQYALNQEKNQWLRSFQNGMINNKIQAQDHSNLSMNRVSQLSNNQNNMNGLKMEQKKDNFKPFLIDNINSLAICEWCESIYVLQGKGLSQFLMHIEFMHPGISMQDYFYQGTVNVAQFLAKKISNFKIQTHMNKNSQKQKQQLDKIQQQQQQYPELIINNENIEFPIIIQTDPQISQISAMLSKQLNIRKNDIGKVLNFICRQFGFEIKQYRQDDHILGLVFLKEGLENITDAIEVYNFWEFCNPVQSKDIKSIIYIFYQGKQIKPILIGFYLIFADNMPSHMQMLSPILKSNNIKSIVLCCDQQSELKAFLETHRNQEMQEQNQEKSQLSIIHVNTAKIPQLEQIIPATRINICSQIQIPFIGFVLTQKFLIQAKLFTPFSFGVQQKAVNFLQTLGNVLKNRSVIKLENFVNNDEKNILKLASKEEELSSLKSSLSQKIFVKVCLNYLYGKYQLNATKMDDNIFMVSQKKLDTKLLKANESFIVMYDPVNLQINCDCNLMKMVKIPCSHILKCIQGQNIQIKYFIDPQWYTSCEQENSSVEQIGNQMQEEVSEINNLDVEIMNMKKEEYEIAFWE